MQLRCNRTVSRGKRVRSSERICTHHPEAQWTFRTSRQVSTGRVVGTLDCRHDTSNLQHGSKFQIPSFIFTSSPNCAPNVSRRREQDDSARQAGRGVVQGLEQQCPFVVAQWNISSWAKRHPSPRAAWASEGADEHNFIAVLYFHSALPSRYKIIRVLRSMDRVDPATAQYIIRA